MTTTGTGTNLGFEEDVITQDASDLKQLITEHANKYGFTDTIKEGIAVNGNLIFKDSKYALVDFCGKSYVEITLNSVERSALASYNIGDSVNVMITGISDKKTFNYTGSVAKMNDIKSYSFFVNAYNENTPLFGKPIEMNSTGYTIEVNVNDTITYLFMPHLVADVNKLFNPESLLNTEIEFIVDILNKDSHTLIANRKKFLETLIPNAIKELVKGSQYTGTITGSTDFAVFIQFNTCLTGMIHKSNLAKSTLDRLADIKPGEQIDFYVKDILKNHKDISKSKLFLSEELKTTIWDTIKPDQTFTGTVSSIKDFGLMIQLDYETKGLLHKSHLKNLSDYKLGDSVNVLVTAVNKNNRQITLTLGK